MDSLFAFFTTSPVHAATFSRSLGLIIAMPLVGAFICGVFGRFIGRANTHLVACTAVAGSFVMSVIAFWALNDRHTLALVHNTPLPYTLWVDYGRWFGAGSFFVDYGLLVDHLSGILLLVITGVGLLIHIYSTSYMSHDDGYWRFFAYLNLFVAMMLTLVMADSLPLLFVGWEGVGFCSYLLVGFWYTDEQKAFAGRKAFITNRVGDFGFIIAMILTVLLGGAIRSEIRPANFHNNPVQRTMYLSRLNGMGPLDVTLLSNMITPLAAQAPDAKSPALNLSSKIAQGPLAGFTVGGVLTAILLLFLLGASGKSAQIPLYVWLPDAMAGPTPVSALIHAATMVTAGVYLFSRLSFLLVFSPVAMATVALIGAGTALLAALIAFAQDDLKKILAYSTVSQLGFMFMAVGVGAFWAAVLHLVTHAFFKACLFLGAGSVMHGNHDETNIKKLGGLRKEMPWTWITFLIATLAITGIVPLSGFFSKDAILGFDHRTTLAGLGWVSQVVWGVGLLAAFGTAFYMSRAYLLTFEGERAKDALVPHAHESDFAMVMPLVVLAVLSIAAIAWGIPFMAEHQTVMENFTAPVFDQARVIAERLHSFTVAPEGEPFWSHWVAPLFIAWGIALAGGAAAAFLYLRFFPARAGEPAPAVARTLRRWASNKFYVDELYGLIVIRPLKGLAHGLYRVVDDFLIDSFLVRGTARVTGWAGSALRYVQTGDVQSYAAVMAVALLGGVVYALVVVFK